MSTDSLIGFVYTTRVPDAKEFVESLVSRLALGKRKWVSSTDELSDDDPFLADTVAIVTVGGDGTILRTVRAAAPHGIPILGSTTITDLLVTLHSNWRKIWKVSKVTAVIQYWWIISNIIFKCRALSNK